MINSQYGGLVQSPLFNSGGYRTSHPSDSSSIALYILPQLKVAMNQSVPETRQVVLLRTSLQLHNILTLPVASPCTSHLTCQ